MTDDIEIMLYAQVAHDMLSRFGTEAFDVAEEAKESLLELGDEAGGQIWSEIASAVSKMEAGLVSTALH